MKPQAQSLLSESRESAAETVRQEVIAREPGRNLYRTNKRDLHILEFVTPPGGNGKKKGAGKDPVLVRKEISAYLFEYLKGFHVPTHYLSARDGAEMLVKGADPIPVIVRVFNVPEDHWPERFGATGLVQLEFPVIEHYLPGSGETPAWVNEHHLYALNILKPDEFRQMNRLATKVNAVLRGLCDRRELAPADLRLSFGRYNNQVIVTGELSPATVRFLEGSPSRRRGNGAALPVDTKSEGALEALGARLRLNG